MTEGLSRSTTAYELFCVQLSQNIKQSDHNAKKPVITIEALRRRAPPPLMRLNFSTTPSRAGHGLHRLLHFETARNIEIARRDRAPPAGDREP